METTIVVGTLGLRVTLWLNSAVLVLKVKFLSTFEM
jgi:hypothetical protein